MLPASSAKHKCCAGSLVILVTGVGEYLHLLRPNSEVQSEIDASLVGSCKRVQFSAFCILQTTFWFKRPPNRPFLIESTSQSDLFWRGQKS
jgi:hypothetical protein